MGFLKAYVFGPLGFFRCGLFGPHVFFFKGELFGPCVKTHSKVKNSQKKFLKKKKAKFEIIESGPTSELGMVRRWAKDGPYVGLSPLKKYKNFHFFCKWASPWAGLSPCGLSALWAFYEHGVFGPKPCGPGLNGCGLAHLIPLLEL